MTPSAALLLSSLLLAQTPSSGTLEETATATPPPSATPSTVAHTRVRAGLEQKKLQFLVGDWEVAATRFAAGSAPQAGTGNLSVRFDLGGLMLIERWTIAGKPDTWEWRQMWSWDAASSAFRVFRFDSGGTSGDELAGHPGERSATLERRFHEGGKDMIEKMTYLEPAPVGKEARNLTVTIERGESGGTLDKTFEATLTRSGR